MANERIKEGVRDDGTIEDCFVLTQWLPIESVSIAIGEGGYVRLRADGGPIDYEMRLTFTDMEKFLAQALAATPQDLGEGET